MGQKQVEAPEGETTGDPPNSFCEDTESWPFPLGDLPSPHIT